MENHERLVIKIDTLSEKKKKTCNPEESNRYM